MRRLAASILTLTSVTLLLVAFPGAPRSRVSGNADFMHFESGQVHPLAITPDGTRLLVVNTPDAHLSVFDLTGPLPVRIAEIPVGLEPVSVAARHDTEAWVVNHLSDDVSIVDLTTMHVRATLRVGDEPHDVVFAGSPPRAFVSVGEEDAVKAYDPANLAIPPQRIAMPGRQPRALVRSADGAAVHVAILQGGNRTTVLSEAEAGDSLPPPNPPMSAALPPAPKVGLIVKQNAQGDWRDESGKLWNSKVRYSLHEADVVRIEANSGAITRVVGDLTTVALGLAADPVTGAVAVTGHEARNAVRFEPNLRGRNVDTRVAIVPAAGAATLSLLNPHVNYAVTPGPASERDSALGMPTGVTWSPDGQRLYVTALSNDRLGVLSHSGALLARVATVQGPTGVIADAARGRLYVLGRFRNQLQTLSASSLASLAVTAIGHDPTPDDIVNGRRVFYGGFTSGHGEHSCASCHLFGDMDAIAWDLGDPQGSMAPVPPGMLDPLLTPFHPMKGPMTTQTLRGLPGTGVLHWRGDRANLQAFNGTFVSLLGRGTLLPDSQMAAFADFVLPLRHPPNPRQNLDRSMPDAPAGRPSARRGQQFFMNTPVDGGQTCNFCHTVPTGTNGQMINRSALLAAQDMKIPQLRNMYRKTGFRDTVGAVNKRGFGFIHNGATDNLFEFLRFPGFAFASGAAGNDQRRDVEAFMLAFDTGLAPAVGAQVTFTSPTGGEGARLDTLLARADAGDCEVVAKGRAGGLPRGWRYLGSGLWESDWLAEGNQTTAQVRAVAGPGAELTVTGVPLGSGERMGIDRDRDGFRDADERIAGSDPGNPASTPASLSAGAGAPSRATALAPVRPNPFRTSAEVEFVLANAAEVELAVFDLLGRERRMLARGRTWPAGRHRVTWDGRGASDGAVEPGVYFVRLRTPERTHTRMVLRIP